MSDEEIEDLKKSNQNGMDWFNAYGEVDQFLFDMLGEIGKEFPLKSSKPEINTIDAIKILSNTSKTVKTNKKNSKEVNNHRELLIDFLIKYKKSGFNAIGGNEEMIVDKYLNNHEEF